LEREEGTKSDRKSGMPLFLGSPGQKAERIEVSYAVYAVWHITCLIIANCCAQIGRQGLYHMKKFIFIPLILMTFLVLPRPGWCNVEENASFFLWHLINQARVHPESVIRSLGIDEGAARQALGDEQWIIDEGLPPLAWNNKLAQAALAHGNDMIAHLYYSSVGLDGSTPGDRIRAVGYDPVSEEETLGIVSFSGFIGPMEAVRVVFGNWVRDELNPARQKDRQIFNPDFREMGGTFIGAVLHLGADIPPNVYLAAVEFARPEEIVNYLLGNVYRDVNGNGLMEPDEAVIGATVSIRNLVPSGTASVVSGSTGEYQVVLPKWLFVANVTEDGKSLIKDVFSIGGNENIIMDFKAP
jgi:hypothetical protein